ncbi:hypothetical protein CR513_04506, partial [Mucuna pruriens]
MMKFVNNHLPTPNQDHTENYNDFDPDENYGSYQAIYVYARSNVPEWFEYKTTKGNLIIDLSSSPPSPLLGFIFCFMLEPKPNQGFKSRLELIHDSPTEKVFMHWRISPISISVYNNFIQQMELGNSMSQFH